MRKIWNFVEDCVFWIVSASVVGAIAWYVVSNVQDRKEQIRQEEVAAAKLKSEYKYTIKHHHAQKYSYADVYYANSYETDGQKVEFVDCTGRSRVLIGDVTITEN